MDALELKTRIGEMIEDQKLKKGLKHAELKQLKAYLDEANKDYAID